jgi:hypothetical protein
MPTDRRHASGRDAQLRLVEALGGAAEGSEGERFLTTIVNAFEKEDSKSETLAVVAAQLKSHVANGGADLEQDDLVAFGRYIRHLQSQKRSKRRVRAAAHGGRKVRLASGNSVCRPSSGRTLGQQRLRVRQ